MFNIKAGAIAAALAFFLSFFIGLASRTSMPLLIVRPLIFAVIFFIISALVNILIQRFLPELLEEGASEDISTSFPGAHIDITEGDLPEDYEAPSPELFQGQAFMGAQPDDSENGLGNISDLLEISSAYRDSGGGPAGMDQKGQDGYNIDGGLEEISESGPASSFDAGAGKKSAEKPGISMNFSDLDDVLPDLDSMAGVFSLTSSNEEEDTEEYSAAPPRKSLSSSKDSAWSGDFNAKEMAKGMQTLLNKDKEG